MVIKKNDNNDQQEAFIMDGNQQENNTQYEEDSFHVNNDVSNDCTNQDCNNTITVNIDNHYSLNKIFFDFYILIQNNKNNIYTNNSVLHVVVKNDLEKFLKTHINHTFNLSKALEKNMMDAIYAMASFADEEMINFNWSGKDYWEKNLLEYKFFNTHIAGEEIFNKIDKLLEDSNVIDAENAQLYLNMFALGFKGKYINTPEIINKYRKDLHRFIVHSKEEYIIKENMIFGPRYVFMHQVKHYLPDPRLFMHCFLFFIGVFAFVTTLLWIFEIKPLSRTIDYLESALILNGDK